MSDLIKKSGDIEERIDVPLAVCDFFRDGELGYEVLIWLLRESSVLDADEEIVDGISWLFESRTGKSVRTLADIFSVDESSWEEWFAFGRNASLMKNLVEFLLVKLYLRGISYRVSGPVPS